MKQFLRSFLTLLMLVVWASGFAQDTETIDLTKQGFENATVVSEVTGTDVKLSFAKGKNTNNAPTYYTADKTVRLYVNNTLTISSTTKKIAQIEFTLVPDDKAIEPDTKSFSTGSYSASTHTWTGNTNKIILTQKTSKKQFRIQKLVITFVKEGPSKTPTTLTFNESTINIEEGNEATFTGQPATLKAGGTVLNNAITYTTNNDDMFEAYDTKVGPTTLKTGKYGTATVTAKFNGDKTYEASTATYTVNYTEKEKPATTLDFGFTTKTVNIEEIFTAAATLKSGETAITGAVTYSSSTPEVAYVDEATGEVMALTAGKAKITATFAGTSEYKSSTASYELTVVDPNAPLDNIVFDAATKGFDDMYYDNAYPSGTKNAAFKSKDGKTYAFSYSNCMRNNAKNYNPDVIQMRNNKKGMGTFTSPVFDEMPNGYKVNVYYGISEGNKPLTITSNEETSATSISNAYGEDDRNNGTGYCTSIILSNSSSFTVNVGGSTCYVSKIEILPLSAPITLEENATDTDTKIEKNNGKTQDVTLTRTLVADKWNTFCVPFETEITGTALEGATVKAVGTIEGNVINLVDATKIEAGVPYLVMPTTGDIVNPTFKNVTISVTTPKKAGNDEYKFVGTYSTKKIYEDEFGKIWGVTAEGKLAKIKADTTMKGLRAYFVFPTNTAAAKLNFDGETTGINNIETNATVNGKVYNLNGQYVGNSLNGLKKGIYVVNGKKVIK